MFTQTFANFKDSYPSSLTALFFEKNLGLIQWVESFNAFNAVLIIAFDSFPLPTPLYRISLKFSSGDLPFPHPQSMRSQWHSDSYLKMDPWPKPKTTCTCLPEVGTWPKPAPSDDISRSLWMPLEIYFSSPQDMNLRGCEAGIPAAILWPWGDCPSENGANPKDMELRDGERETKS